MLFNTLALTSLLIIITLLPRLVNIFPSLLACMIRWKESVNLEMSVKLSRDRNVLAAAMIIPYCLAIYRSDAYELEVIERLNEPSGLCATAGVFVTYILLRQFCAYIIRPKKSRSATYNYATAASRTFFIILTLLLLATGWVLSFIGTEADTIKTAMIWISAVIYFIFLIRKIQIFASSYNYFTVFLYLCALEILPTGVLITSAIFF